MTRFAVLVSGSGTNLQALLDFWRSPPLGYPTHRSEIAVVVSNRPGVPALDRAKAAGVPAEVVDHRAFPTREAFEESLERVLERHGASWIVLAGFMRLLTPAFVARRQGRILNVHPALLPAFPGRDPVADAIRAGVKVSGCTVHFVDEGVDTGPIVAQAAVPVLETDRPEDLHARIRRVEHAIYPKVVAKVLAGGYRIEGRTVHLEDGGP